MKALVLEEYQHFVYKDVPNPTPADDEVLVSIKATSVCGSDVHGMDGSTGRRIPPIVMGHEASGIVVQTGKDVQNYRINDRVTFDSTIYCGKCQYCKNNQVNLCENRKVLGVSCDEYKLAGTFAEYVAIPERVLYKIPDTVSFEEAAMLEPLSVACHAVSIANLSNVSTAAVIGCGTIGLLIAQVLRSNGIKRIILADISEEKIAQAGNLGFCDTINLSKCDFTVSLHQLVGEGGVDLAFDAVGTNETVSNAINAVRKGGVCVLVGNVAPKVELPLQTVVTRQLSILGSCASAGEYARCLDMLSKKTVDVKSLISKRVPLADGNEWIHRVYNQEKGLHKIVMIP